MSRHSASLVSLPLACVTFLASLMLLHAQSAELPPGPVCAKFKTACLECHDADIILQQRLSKAAWGREVDKMIRWGAVVDQRDRDAFIDYLSTNFAEEKEPYVAPRTAMLKKKPAR